MAATWRTTAFGLRARSGRFEVLGRVGTGGDGFLQLFYRGRGLGGGFFQVGAGRRSVGAPLRFATQVYGTTVGQFEGHGTGLARQNLVASKQAIAFDQDTLDPFLGHSDDLANNTLDDGDNTAHETLRTNRSMWLPYAIGLVFAAICLECFARRW